MNTDAESRIPPPEHPDIWQLPQITSVEIRLARYQPPRRHVAAGRIVERTEGVEILVHTDSPIPVRALSPALYIGDTVVVENQQIDPSLHQFFVIDASPQPGAPIALGWVGHPPQPADARFHYQPPEPGGAPTM